MKENEVIRLIMQSERHDLNSRWMHCENATATGVPDINACVSGHEFWVEIKCPVPHKRAATPVFGSSHKLSPVQFAWLKRQSLAGGRCFVLVCNENMTFVLAGSAVSPEIHKLSCSALAQHGSCVLFRAESIQACWSEVRDLMVNYCRGNVHDR